MNAVKVTLGFNALTCIGFGLLFAIAPQAVADYLGAPPALLIRIIGIGLVINGGHLLITAGQQAIKITQVYYFSLGDFGWVVGSGLIVMLTDWVTTQAGLMATAAVAILVGMIGLSQIWAARRAGI